VILTDFGYPIYTLWHLSSQTPWYCLAFQSLDLERTWWRLFQSLDFERTWWRLFQSLDFERTWWRLFQSLDFERTWWRLFQKRVLRTKLYIYVLITKN
jgi:hypothetical protein